MSVLVFDHATLRAYDADGADLGAWPAANNVDSHCKGPWPPGEFDFLWLLVGAADGPDGAYGSHGIFIFDVPGRTGMGVHSGRATVPDGLNRCGVAHCTLGCIRTEDAAMARLRELHARDPIKAIKVIPLAAEDEERQV